MKANPDKCHFIASESKAFVINLKNNQITNSKCEKLLWIKIDHKLTFYAHIDEICKKAGQKMNTLSRVIPYMNITKRRSLLNTFFMSQFTYCPLTWICHSRAKNNKRNHLQKRCLRIVYKDGGHLLLSNYCKRIVLSLYIQGILVFLQLKCSKLLRILQRQSLIVYFL